MNTCVDNGSLRQASKSAKCCRNGVEAKCCCPVVVYTPVLPLGSQREILAGKRISFSFLIEYAVSETDRCLLKHVITASPRPQQAVWRLARER